MSVPQKSFEPGAECPLDGVRVIDTSRLVSGNMVSLQLADFGAEVLKIEDPKRDDPLRAWQTDGVSVHWKAYSRNKKSVALSLRELRGRELLLDLIDSSQVLIENFRPGTLEVMGLGPDILHRRNPGLIIVRVSGWGQDGPYRDRPGFGTLVESMSGYASRTGFPDREPALPPTALADLVAGLYGACSVSVALRHREVGGGDDMITDPRFRTNSDRVRNAEACEGGDRHHQRLSSREGKPPWRAGVRWQPDGGDRHWRRRAQSHRITQDARCRRVAL
jgi:crotonobetainyl-CoA:carnitine CoA-transferase CaiB-like acyl-CoA transferase